MKKLLLLTFLTLAIASFGGTMTLAHAQTVTGSQVTLQQQLELMKAKLQLLQLEQIQAEQASVTPVQTETQTAATIQTQATMDISAADAAALNAALSSLATTLVSLQSAIQSNPQFIAQNGPVVARSLAGIGTSLASVLTSMQGGSLASAGTQPQSEPSAMNSAPLAAANQNNPSQAPEQSPALNQGSLLPSVDSITQSANTESNQAAATTASALGGKNRLPAVIVGIILLAMIAILVWGRGSEELAVNTVSVEPKKTAPAIPPPVAPSISFMSNQAPAPTHAPYRDTGTASPSQSPLASSMGNQRKNA
jgi:hypothetical protein